MPTIHDTKIRNFFQLDNQKTYNVLCSMANTGLISYKLSPEYSYSWRETNPISFILNDENLRDEFARYWGKKPTLTEVFTAMAICQAVIMDRIRGPEGDGRPQMLRKHWYAWGKLGLQPAATWLQTALMEDGTPDSEKLYDLMSRTFGDWNEKGLVEYKDLWILNDTSKYAVNDRWSRLPEPYEGVIVCCEKDAAFDGVLLSAQRMGAAAVYSGGGKSSRSGIERLYDECLADVVERDHKVYVLVISDWDTDGESVIAPTFVNQLKTYIPEELIESVRVGVTPEQITRFGYDLEVKGYEIKYRVGPALNSNYLLWSREKGLTEMPCENCGNTEGLRVGYKCPHCGWRQLPPEEEDGYYLDLLKKGSKNGAAEIVEAWKKRFTDVYDLYKPHGFELDALPRTAYAELLVEGLATLIDMDDLRDKLSKRRMPTIDEVLSALADILLERTRTYQELQEHIRSLRNDFDNQMRGLDRQESSIREDLIEELRPLVEDLEDDERIFDRDPEVDDEALANHMKNGSSQYDPYSKYRRRDRWIEIVQEDFPEQIEEITQREYEFQRMVVTLEPEDNDAGDEEDVE